MRGRSGRSVRPSELALMLRNPIDVPAEGGYAPVRAPRCDQPPARVELGQGAIRGQRASAAWRALPPGARWDGPASGEALLVVTDGSGRLEIDGRLYDVVPGSALSVRMPAAIVSRGDQPLTLVEVRVDPR